MTTEVSFDRPFAALGDRLTALRIARCLTQRQLAHAAGITQRMVSEYEHGRIRPTRGQLSRIAATLGADEHELMRLARYET